MCRILQTIRDKGNLKWLSENFQLSDLTLKRIKDCKQSCGSIMNRTVQTFGRMAVLLVIFAVFLLFLAAKESSTVYDVPESLGTLLRELGLV